MPPIPIHKNAPIAPVKPDGTTPSTASSNPATEKPPPTRTTPASVPATTTASSNPPAPQPGARPLPPTAAPQTPYNVTSPAPPQPGAGPGYTAHHITTETRRSAPPPQFSHPPPSDTQLAGRSTTTATTASKPGPTTLNYGPAASPYQSADAAPTRSSLEHPPGYQQAPDNAPYTVGGGIGAGGGGGVSEGVTEGVGAAAWNMLSKAGEALKKGEEAAWKAVRNK
jgi:hypothetical protein